MENKIAYPAYRFVILGIFMLITVAIEIQWLTHAAVARPAEVFYQGQFQSSSFFNIDFMAVIYMLAFIVMSFPASYVIDTYGIKKALRFGAVLLAVFSLLKAVFATNYWGVVIAQTGLAIAQPFILNAVTAVTVRWFPINERAMAAGFSALAQYVGIVIAMLITPVLVVSDPTLSNYGDGFSHMLTVFGVVSVVSAVVFIVLIREKPIGIEVDKENRPTFKDGMKLIISHRDMRLTIVLFLIGLGIFNAVSSMTDSIAENLGVKDSDGLIGGLMLIGGIVGALILPILSDYLKKRKLFLVICLLGMVPGLIGLAFAKSFSDDLNVVYNLALVSSFLLGFFVMSAGPIGFQYAAEVCYPAPESASQGILLWVGQLTGMLFVSAMSIHNNQYLNVIMAVFVGLSLLSVVMVLLLKESPFMLKKEE